MGPYFLDIQLDIQCLDPNPIERNPDPEPRVQLTLACGVHLDI